MNFFLNIVVVLIVGLTLRVTADEKSQRLAWSRDEDGNRTARQIQCIENLEYPQGDSCCKNCEAGTYVKKPCTKASEQGTCAPCEAGTFTEHPNGMSRCLPCSSCRKDQEMMSQCTSTRDTQCQCAKGSFCVPDQACEMCKRCNKCKESEEKVKDCTPTSNTLCRKKSPSPTPTPRAPDPSSTSSNTTVAVSIVACLAALLLAGVLYWCWKRQPWKRTEIQSDPSEVKIDLVNGIAGPPQGTQDSQSTGTEEPQQESQPLLQHTQEAGAKSSPVEDEDKGLGDSLPNTTNSSQTSLSALPTVHSCSSSPRHSPETPRQPPYRGDFQHRRLIPLNGEESLKKSFDLFDECLDIKIHNKFFRGIGLTDNMIKTAESTHPGDKVYELLKTWMQREGLKADINYLIEELLNLDQKLSAESICSKAVEKRYYKYDEDKV